MLWLATMLSLALALLGAPAPAKALDILLTNDDGYAFIGITTLRAALCAAGHHVTVLAPATNQSGRGGGFNSGTGAANAMALTRQSSDACGAIYSLAAPTGPGSFGGTPVDCVSTALDVLLANDPPDLVISGLNPGPNPSKGAPSNSGTVGAASVAALRGFSPFGAGIPSIAASVSVIFGEAGAASTIAALAPASSFIARLIAALDEQPGDDLLPRGVRMLNINFPVPYPNITGIKLTRAGDKGDFLVPFYDRSVGFAPFPPVPGLSCVSLADGQSCSVGVAFVFDPTGPDTERNADVDAVRANQISITPMDLDPSAGGAGAELEAVLNRLVP